MENKKLKKMRQPQSKKIVDPVAAWLYARYGKYAVPDEELRKMLEEEMGEKTLTEELYAMRDER